MNETPVLKIVNLCRHMDETARDVYAKFSEQCQVEPLRKFWLHMSKEESEHVRFWLKAEQLDILPDNIFVDPDKVIEELEYSVKKTNELLEQCQGSYDASDSFILSYRLEFYLLHPAFSMLFKLLGPMEGVRNPETNYDSHIADFINVLVKYGQVTPELELLGETLQRLWKENKALAQQATRDDLTGLFNRRGFFTTATQLMYLAQRSMSTVGVLMIDLDHFKTINDRLGHLEGDHVLKEAASIILNSLRSSDLMGRYGGEEFIVLLPATGTAMTAAVAEKIRSSLESATIEGVSLTLSIGFSEGVMGNRPQEDLQALIKLADEALYEAKASGRNRVVEYQKQGADESRHSGTEETQCTEFSTP